MSKAIALSQEAKTVSQVFKEWAARKGVGYFKRKNLREHLERFYEESGLTISSCLAHGQIARLVHQRNRRARQERVRAVTFFYRPSLHGQFC